MDFGTLIWPNMGSALNITSPFTSNGWTTTEISNETLTNTESSTKKKKKKKSVIPQRSDDKLIEFYKKDRRFISIPISEEKTTEHKDDTLTVRLMTYNILADGRAYALSPRHNYCPTPHRQWKYRFQSILCQLKAYQPDIVCIQETTPSSWNNKMKEALKSIGYIGIHGARVQFDRGRSQSDCIILKENKYTLIKHKILRLNEFIKKAEQKSDKSADYDTNYDILLGSDKSMFRAFCRTCYDIVIVLHLISKETQKQFIVCSSHFFWDPNNPEIKASQALIFNIELERLLKYEWKWNDDDDEFDINTIPIIFGVDSNSLPFKSEKDEYDPDLPQNGAKSGVYELMVDGLLRRQHKDHPFGRINNREKRYQKVHQNKMGNKEIEYVGQLPDWSINIRWRSVYSMVNKRNKFKEPIFTNRTVQFTDTLDYIFISDKCGIKAFLEMPWQKTLEYHTFQDGNNEKFIQKELKKELKLCEKFPFLPNVDHPSDHLPLCADIVIH